MYRPTKRKLVRRVRVVSVVAVVSAAVGLVLVNQGVAGLNAAAVTSLLGHVAAAA